MKSIKPNESFFTTYAQYLGVVLTLAMGVIAFGYANPSSAAPKSCDEHPRPSCDDGSGGGGDGDTILFDAKLVGEDTGFGVLIAEVSCMGGTADTRIVVGGEEIDLGVFVSNPYPDQAFGHGTAVLKPTADDLGVNFFNTNIAVGGSNDVRLPGANKTCSDPNDPIAGHLDVRFSIDRSNTNECPDDDPCVWLTEFRGGSQMSNNKYARCEFDTFSSNMNKPVALHLEKDTIIPLYHRCVLRRQGKETSMGTLSWGEIHMSPR